MIEPFRMEEDPDGTSQQVAVIMTGKVYREAGLKYSKHPEVEGLLYDKLCRIGKHKLRDDVRKIALSIALSVSDKEFQPTVAWLDDFMRRFCLSKKKMGFHSSAMLKQKGFTQPEVKSSATTPSMSQEDVFSVLGLNVDCDSSSNTDKNSTSVIEKDKDSEIPVTSGDNCVESASTESASVLADCGENTSPSTTMVEKNVNGTPDTNISKENDDTNISKENDVSDADKRTLENVVDDLPDDKAVSEMDDACSEDGNVEEKSTDELPDIFQETVNAHKTNKGDCDDEVEEVVLLQDDSEDNREEQNSDTKKDLESKIGKISIRKIEDLCEKKGEKEKKDGGSKEKNSEEEISSASDSSGEGEDTPEAEDDGTSDEESEAASDNEEQNAPVSKQTTSKYEVENIDYSSAENKYYKKNIDALQKKLEGSVIKCTSCYEQVNHHIRSLVFTHPVLGVFICKKCRKYYGRGKFCKDKEGYDEYCRLCAEGGDLLCCEQEDCFNGFCKRCVKRILGRAELKHAEATEGWACYVCDPTPLMELRALHRLILNNLKNSEEEDAVLSRNDLKSKTLQNKFKSLKQMRQLKAQKETPRVSKKLAEDKISKTDSNNDKKKEEISKEKKKNTDSVIAEELKKRNSKQTDNKISENECEENKPCPVLRNSMDAMLEMMAKCLENVKIIDSKWKKSKYSSFGTERARHHVLKQLEAMKTNFATLKNDLIESSSKEVVKMNDTEKEQNETEQSGKKLRRAKGTEDKKQKDNSSEEQSNLQDRTYQEGNHILENHDSPNKSDTLDKQEKEVGDKGVEGQGLSSQIEEKLGMEVASSGELADPVDPFEDGSQHSSKACLTPDDDHSLPDLMDVVKDLISDPEEPMDTEAKTTGTKCLDIENDVSRLTEDVRQKSKTDEEDVGNSITADCTDKEVEKFSNKEASDSGSCRNERQRNATNESKTGSDVDEEEKALQKTSQHCKKIVLARDSDNNDASENRKLNRKGEKKGKNKDVSDDNEGVETGKIDDSDDEKDIDKGKGGLSSCIKGKEQELVKKKICKNQKKQELGSSTESGLKNEAKLGHETSHMSSQQASGLEIGKDGSEDNNEDKDVDKLEKDQVQNDEILDSNKSEEGETDKGEDDEIKKRGKRKGKSRGSDASDKEMEESGSVKETATTRRSEESTKRKRDSDKDTTAQKKKKGSSQNSGLSRRSKVNQKKEESGMDDNAEKPGKARRGKQRRRSESVEEDRFLGLVEGSETSEEENTDEEIQRRREDHTEKRKVKKRKMEKKRSFESEDKKEKKENISSEVKPIKVVNGEDRAESEDEKEQNDCKDDTDSLEEKKIKKTEKNVALSCKMESAANTEKEGDTELGKNDSSIKEECDVKQEENRESLPSDQELSEKEVKVSKKKKVHSIKTENQIAKAAILESESDIDLEEKPMPRSKKKRIRRHLDPQNKQKSHRNNKSTLTEEEQDELKETQLNGKCRVLVEYLSSKVREKLEEDEFVYTSDYPELKYSKTKKQLFDSDGCDADEEDSDKEFSRLMKFKDGKIKPGPKSKVLKRKSKNEKDEKSDEEAGDAANSEEMESADKKHSKKICKKKKEGLLDIDIDKDEEENEEDEVDEVKKKNKDGGISLNEKMKKHILLSSEEEAEEEEEEEDQGDNLTKEEDEEERERKKYDKKKEKEAKKRVENEEDSDGEYAPKVYKKGYMNLNISTDEEQEEVDDEEEEEEVKSAYEDDSDFEESPRKRRAFQISSSDSEDTKKKTKKAESSDEESEEEEEKPKSKRKRIRKMSSSSDDDDEEENKESPSKHKKIRKVIKDEDLMETTKNATQEEEERRKRIAERQKNYNEIFMVDVGSDQKDMDKLVLDFDPESKSELVSVHDKLVKLLKPHQFKGIKFMWDASVESLEQLKSSSGGGCILAHCMGLGKTFQVITFCHTLLTNKSISKEVQRIMVCCPVNTIFNWVAEFKNWLKGKMLSFDVIELASAKDLWGRAYRLDDWWKEGGICIIGYSMFRNLSNSNNKRYKGKMKEIFQKTLLDPGPDIVVCDEGHMLKNEKTALSVAINKIRTKRRIVLTGTPLQNNLKEYHCMIQFVKPNLLGTKKEFMNRFVNPIEQGQCVEAMPRDVRRMKRRAHILHNLLEGCVQRFDYTVLKPFLPPKFEYVISVQLSDIQCKLYQYYLDNLARGGPKRQSSGLFVDFVALGRVWTHPKMLELAVRRAVYDEEEELDDDFICDDSTTSESSDDERSRRKKKGAKKKDEESEEENEEEDSEKPGPIPGLTESGKVRVDWWKKVLVDNVGEDFEEEGYLDKIEHGGKLILLMDILKGCCSIGDKVLLFSQSLLTLDMIEDFLQAIDEGELELPKDEDSLPLPYKNWKRERDYLRLDGSTTADTRKYLCNVFNNTSNERCRLFLISTRAGGLGINLVGANRVIIFDSSWNPSHDTQSIFRIYRFGQKKPCYIYRFVAQGTMEEKIYSRQVTKMSTALRVVDEHQIKRYFKMEELAQLYEFNPSDVDIRETPIVPKDRLLAELLQKQKDWIVTYHEQDSLLENQTSEELSEEERKAAWEDYENEKKGLLVQQHRNSVMSVMDAPTMMNHPGLPSLSLSSFNFESVVNSIKSQNPNMSPLEICESVLLATKQIQKIHLNHYQRVQAMLYNLKNPMIAPEQRKLLPFGSHPEMLPLLEGQLRVLEDNIQRENQIIAHIDQGVAQQNHLLSTANLMSAGLIRGQPASSGINSATTNYVEGPSTSSVGGPSHQEKKTASNDVILLD